MSRRPRPFSPEDFGEQGANGQGTGSFLALDEANGAGPEATFGRRFGEAKHSARLDLDVAGEEQGKLGGPSPGVVTAVTKSA